MNEIIRYGVYKAKLFCRMKVSVFYSIILPIVLLLMYYAANSSSGNIDHVNGYFPYLISITLISTTASLTTEIVDNRIYNMWKFYNFFGYKTWQMTIATECIYFMLSEFICLIMSGIMILFLHTTSMSIARFLLFMVVIGLGNILYIEIAVIVGLCINDPKNAQTIISGISYVFVILSGSIFQFGESTVIGKIMLVFPNIHVGNLLYTIWNGVRINVLGAVVLPMYLVVFGIIIFYLIRKERRKLLY